MKAVGADEAGGGSVNPILEMGWSPVKAASDLGHFPVKGKWRNAQNPNKHDANDSSGLKGRPLREGPNNGNDLARGRQG